MNNKFKIDEGKTYEYVVHGLVIFILGLILLPIHWILTSFVLLISIGLFTIKTGVEINFETNSIRKYSNLLGFKGGKWYDLRRYHAVELRYNSQRLAAGYVNWSGYFSPKPRSIATYDLLLINKQGESLLLNPFLSFSAGDRTTEALKKINGLAVRNFAAERLARQKKKK